MKKDQETGMSPTTYLKNRPRLRIAASAVLSLAFVWAFSRMLRIEGEDLWYTNSIFSVLFFFVLFLWIERVLQAGARWEKGRWFWPGCVSCAFSLSMVFGVCLDLEGNVPFKNGFMWLAIVILTLVFTLTVRYIWELPGGRKAAGSREDRKFSPGSFFLTAGIIFLCYLPVFLAVYPGFFVYDAQEEYLQVVTRNFSTHHPLMHVLLLGGLVQLIYKLTGSYNLGIACYTVLQMAVMAGIFAWCVEKLKERGMGKACRGALTLYFGLCPVLVMFSLCSVKDGLFTGMILIMVILLQELCKDPAAFFERKGGSILLAVSSIAMMLLRHNGFYAFLVFGGVFLFYLWRRENARAAVPRSDPPEAVKKPNVSAGPVKKGAVLFLSIVAVYLLVSALLIFILHADSSEHQEMLTVPISQLARVYVDEKDSLPSEEKEILYRYLPKKALLRYTPKVTDGVKISFDNNAFAQDKGSFFRLWAKWGIRHPLTYLNAWFMTSYGFWYPDTIIDVYRGNVVFTFTYEDSSYFGYEVEQPGTRESKIPWLNELYRKMSLEIFQQKIPVVSMLFSPGFLFWVMVFMLGFFCYRREYDRVMPYLFPVFCYLTVLLGPTSLVRYVVFLWVIVPLLAWELWSSLYAPDIRAGNGRSRALDNRFDNSL